MPFLKYVLFPTLIAAAIIALLVLLASYYCYRRIFYSPPRKKLGEDEFELPPGEIYEEYRDQMVGWMKETRGQKPVISLRSI